LTSYAYLVVATRFGSINKEKFTEECDAEEAGSLLIPLQKAAAPTNRMGALHDCLYV